MNDELKLVEEAGQALYAKNRTNQAFLNHLRAYVHGRALADFSLASFNAHVSSFTGSYEP